MASQRSGFMLTTLDNPYSPFDDWHHWLAKDLDLGYDTCGLIGRMVVSAPDIDEAESTLHVMSRIVENNFSGVHVMVTRDDYNPLLIPFEV